MSTGRPKLLGPSRLQPVEVDLRRVFLAGTALWLVALVVAVPLAASGRIERATAATFAAGVVLGLLALLWERRRRRRDGADSPPG